MMTTLKVGKNFSVSLPKHRYNSPPYFLSVFISNRQHLQPLHLSLYIFSPKNPYPDMSTTPRSLETSRFSLTEHAPIADEASGSKRRISSAGSILRNLKRNQHPDGLENPPCKKLNFDEKVEHPTEGSSSSPLVPQISPSSSPGVIKD